MAGDPWRGRCLATVRLTGDLRRSFNELRSYWRSQGISSRYLDESHTLAFNCNRVGEDLVSSDSTRRIEAIEAMAALYIYPLAQQLQRSWHFADDAIGRVDHAWDEIEEASIIIRDALSTLATVHSSFDPERGDLCHYILWPRIGWRFFEIERQRLGRKESDRLVKARRAGEHLGVRLESYTQVTEDSFQSELVLRDESHKNLDYLLDTPFMDFYEAGLLKRDDLDLLSLRYGDDLPHREVASKLRRPVAAIRQQAHRTQSALASSLTKCFLTAVLDSMDADHDLEFRNHAPLVQEAMRLIVTAIEPSSAIISHVTPTLLIGPTPEEMGHLYDAPIRTPGMNKPHVSIEIRSAPGMRTISGSFESKTAAWNKTFMLVGGKDAEWLWQTVCDRSRAGISNYGETRRHTVGYSPGGLPRLPLTTDEIQAALKLKSLP